MLSRWPIRKKLAFGIALLMCTIAALSITSFIGVYAFRGLAKSIRLRAPELGSSSRLARDVSRLSLTYEMYLNSLTRSDHSFFEVDDILLKQFHFELDLVKSSFASYRELREHNRQFEAYKGIPVHEGEAETIEQFQQILDSLVHRRVDLGVMYDNDPMTRELSRLTELSDELPTHLQLQMENFADEVRGNYRAWIGLIWCTAILSAFLLVALLRLFYVWIFRPLRVLIHGSRRVAGGDFQHSIKLDSKDEMSELSNAMNSMTARFREIRDDLDQQVQQRTQEVVRGEQLASVGFLAAGVAHEINNPLASIAFCAESLEERLSDVISQDDEKPDDDHNAEITVLREYLRMVQDEAFRCKEITERLLDFSRLGDVEKSTTDLAALVVSVVEMLKHIGKYREKTIVFEPGQAVLASINPQEFKQVVLNLLTNALDSLDPGGHVYVRVRESKEVVQLVVKDEGCGMTEEVRKHLFEPFFTRRRDGQGTGLGMSITYRIVQDHGGDIFAESNGPGSGSMITVTLPSPNQPPQDHFGTLDSGTNPATQRAPRDTQRIENHGEEERLNAA